jgi:hypothetical protein
VTFRRNHVASLRMFFYFSKLLSIFIAAHITCFCTQTGIENGEMC